MRLTTPGIVLFVVVLLVAICHCRSAYSEELPPPCSLNGEKDEHGACLCDTPWSGNECEILQVLPVTTFPQGYGMTPNKTTWGGDIIFQDEKYHLYATAMTGGCSLRSWTTHSRIEHAVSNDITGPFIFQDVAIPTFAHNPKVIQLHDGKFALIHIGTGSGPKEAEGNCSSASSQTSLFGESTNSVPSWKTTKSRRTMKQSEETVGSTIHTAESVDGPWAPLLNHSLGSCNNPAPFVVPNGKKSSTIYIICSHARKGELKRAESISGPWTTVSQITSLQSVNGRAGMGDQQSHYEDPALYIDKRGFHVIYHAYIPNEHPPHGHDCTRSTVSKHVFSKDGKDWFESPGHPYGTQVELLGGETITVATRERPSLLFEMDSMGQTRLSHLLNGVCSAPDCPGGPPAGCVNCKYDH